MHWYVVERYHSQLAKLGKTEGRSSPPLPTTVDQVGGANVIEAEAATVVGEEEEDPSQPLSSVPINNRKWLKGVALNRVQVSSGTRRSSVDFAESAQPYLSTYERDGLLALIQEMLGNELFIPDAPHTYPNPKQLLEELKEQLQSSSVERVCTSRPTGVGLVHPQPVSRGSGHIGSRKKGGGSSGTPRKRGRKVDEDGIAKGVKIQKKDEEMSKRKRKPLLVSVPKSLLMKGALGGEREVMSQNGSQDGGEIGAIDTGNGELVVPDKVEEGDVKDEEGFEVVRLESEELALTGQLLTPPMSLSSASADSMSPSPSPSPIPPSSPLTPSSSHHPFTLKLELDSPIMMYATPLSQATPTSQSTTLHLLSQETHIDSSDTVSTVESPLAPTTDDSISE
jgi:hypothetical protein